MSRLLLFLVLISSLISINYYANPPDGYTGAPLNDEYSCTICHQTDINSPLGSSRVNGFPLKIKPGEEYNLEVLVKSDDAKYSNFQLMIVDGDKSIGTFSNTSGTVKTSKFKDREYAESRPALKIKEDSLLFKFSWKAPGSGDNKLLTLYYTTIIANGDASFAGDRVLESKRIGILGNSLDVAISEHQDNLCPKDSSAYAKIDVSGGQKPYSYLWSTGNTTEEVKGLKAGDYFVTVTDKNGLLGVGFVKITEPAKMKLSNIYKIDYSDEHKGSIEIDIEGGSGQYSYKWHKENMVFSSDKNIYDLSPGCYKLIVEDSCHSIIDSTICISDISPTNESNTDNDIIIFPNPVKDILMIKRIGIKINNLKIINSKGKNIKIVNQESYTYKIDVSSLLPGMYFLLSDSDKGIKVSKFIIMK